jgi:hypothetical protein
MYVCVIREQGKHPILTKHAVHSSNDVYNLMTKDKLKTWHYLKTNCTLTALQHGLWVGRGGGGWQLEGVQAAL